MLIVAEGLVRGYVPMQALDEPGLTAHGQLEGLILRTRVQITLAPRGNPTAIVAHAHRLRPGQPPFSGIRCDAEHTRMDLPHLSRGWLLVTLRVTLAAET
ncbi:hypothetical protein Kisp01_11890 [Kineosporia sp. NBRC 101677]|nr:hypothetical protein Kisp01_11890 [Kineosporia sp. NBRC 101677]